MLLPATLAVLTNLPIFGWPFRQDPEGYTSPIGAP
jgi:hypothetical protein